jgi:hypothetical protein
MAAGDIAVTLVAKAVPVANAPLDGLVLTSMKAATEVIGGVEHLVLKGYAVRPAQKGQESLSIGGEEVVTDPTPVCIGTILVMDKATAITAAAAIDTIADTISLS